MITPYLIFTDLDGTLLDHYSYESESALPMLQVLKARDIPVIINTSKTFFEVIDIAEQLALNAPLITENGAACYFPNAIAEELNSSQLEHSPHQGFMRKVFTHPHQHWVGLLNRVAGNYKGCFKSFSTLGINGIQELTGLTRKNASKAAQREFGEPVAWLGNDEQKHRFIKQLESMGASPVEGGRFIHICGDCNKGMAMQWLTKLYADHLDSEPTTVALGDGKNDIAMLEKADIAVRVLSPVHTPPALTRSDRVYTTQAFGPAGWAEALSKLLTLD
ncbi:HAD-IIB family hydrolase [Alteromonas flava]|uniref:HAD-IIB family hydrolase n=1 Tax=Alteromonas flava TaxID=2048003 RepID=UPI000C282EFE|nr:HAD-IIB family hydrolase [Alteromonas flava]